MKKTRSIPAATLALLGIISCSDSVLFERDVPQNKTQTNTLPNSNPSGGGSPTGGSTAPAAPKGTVFVLSPDASIADAEAFQTLFANQAIDPFKTQNSDSGGRVEIKLSLDAKNRYTDYIAVKLNFSMKRDGKPFVSRGFESQDGDQATSVSFRATSDGDILDGVLVASDGRACNGESVCKISISGKRATSRSQQEAQKNPWSGVITINRQGRPLQIGTFSGFSE